MSDFEPVIGLEVHAQLSTDSKIFAPSIAKSGEASNSLTDPVTLGLPGSLPVLNKRVIDFAIKLGLATNCKIKRESIFARKHYHYPDLPKGYQISQYDKPICEGGKLDILVGGYEKTIGITRIHIEEDAGKNIHLEGEAFSIVDYNRAGVALLEIVSEPDLRTPAEAGAYMRNIRQIVRYLDICDGNMEEGSLRCDANVSVRHKGTETFGTKVEIKNLNSFRFVERAIEYEIKRQITAIENGESITQETRLWDENKGITKVMRVKEFAEDYRYFPDPDLLPLIVDNEWIARIQSSLPELPRHVFLRFKNMYGIEDSTAEILSEENLTASYYDQALSFYHNPISIANWILTELFGRLNNEGLTIKHCPVSPENLALLVKFIDDQVISGKIAKTVFDDMFSSGASPTSILETRGLKQISDPLIIEKIISKVIENNPAQVLAYRNGKEKMFGYFVGQVMKETEGKANPKLVNELLMKFLK